MPADMTTNTMANSLALQRLLIWASPAFPVGTFAYSGGLETAIADGTVRDPAATQDWIEGNLRHGAARNDAILAVLACRSQNDQTQLHDLADLCLALTPARQRHEELLVTGRAFVQAAAAWPDPVHGRLPDACPYPIAFGAMAGAAAITPADTALAFLTATSQAQISVAVRLVPIGQTHGLAILAALELIIAGLAETLANADEDDLGTIAYATDIAAMNHENLLTRIFRS